MEASPSRSKPDVTREEFRELLGEVRELAHRVAQLEQREHKPAAELPPVPVPELHVSSDLVPAIGRTLLAIAGAYLLRALTELGVLPAQAGVAAGIAYAGFWLWHATRASAKLTATLNALTASFILIPLIWEATMRLHAVSTWTAAAVITAFSLSAIWKPDVATWSCSLGSAVAIVLLIGTHDLMPFTLALLAIAAGAELAAIRVRWIVALCADAAILIVAMIVGRGASLPEGYAPVPAWAAPAVQGLLFAVYVGIAALRALVRRRTFTVYEIGQTACAFALAVGGVLYRTQAATPIGMFTAVSAALCYAIAFKIREPSRNRHAYAAFAGLLAIAAGFLLLSNEPLVAAWSALAIGLSWTTLASIQAPAFLWLAAAVSSVATGAGLQLFGHAAPSFPFRAALILVVAAAVSYGKVSVNRDRWPALLIAAALVWSAAGLGASFGVGAVTLLALAVALAWGGKRWHRPELVWLMYPVMLLAGATILIRDSSRENTMTLVVSLLLYGATLILLPRLITPSR